MNSSIFDEKIIVTIIGQMDIQNRAVFAAACATRLAATYVKFAQLTKNGNFNFLETILQALWEDLAQNQRDIRKLSVLLETCMQLMPSEDPNPFGIEQALAEDAVSSTAYAIRCRINGSAQEAAWAARRVYEALDNYVINTSNLDINNIKLEDKLLNHPLIKYELARQQRDLNDLTHNKIAIDLFQKRAIDESYRL